LLTADVTMTFARLGLALDSFGSADDLATSYDAWWVLLERTTPTVDELRLAAWLRVLSEHDLVSSDLVGRIASEYGALRSAHGARLFDGVSDFLCDLRAAGLGLGLLTNGGAGQWQKIRSLGIELLFDAIAVAGDRPLQSPIRGRS
jgi:FMN phosphatase YigB (HAD superfamily)